jgi:hypothetical protein
MGGKQLCETKTSDVIRETYRITNLRGLRDRTGNRVKQMTKQAAAARLQKANTSMRSHRLTTLHVSYIQPRSVASASHAASKVRARAAMHMFRLQGSEEEGGGGHKRARRVGDGTMSRLDSRTNQPSSSSRRLGAGRGAPGASDVGRTV